MENIWEGEGQLWKKIVLVRPDENTFEAHLTNPTPSWIGSREINLGNISLDEAIREALAYDNTTYLELTIYGNEG